MLPGEFAGISPAFPVPTNSQIYSEWNGLTKREYVATQLLSGLLASRKKTARKTFEALAREAIEHADELMRQLQISEL